MREGLAREFPEAVRIIDHVRAWVRQHPVQVSREPIVWAAASAIGAGALASSLATLAIYLFARIAAFPIYAVAGSATLIGEATSAAVALRAGGLAALLAYVCVVVARLLASIPGAAQFCERGAGSPDLGNLCTPEGWLGAQWTVGAAIALGVVAARTIGVRGRGPNVALRVTSVALSLSIVTSMVLGLWTVSLGLGGSSERPMVYAGVSAAAMLIAAAVAGALLGRVRQRVATASAAVGVVLLTGWLLSVPLALTMPPTVMDLAAPPVAAFFIGLAAPPLAVAVFLVSLSGTRLGVTRTASDH